MSARKYELVDVAEDAIKASYSVGVFCAKLFYQVNGLGALGKAMDSFAAERFKQRLEYFVYEHENLSMNEKEDFYNDLKSNKQNLNYLYELVEKTRTTTYDIHAKIYAVMSVRLAKNRTLTYFENDLLSNLYLLNEDDILHLAFILRIIDFSASFYKNKDDSFRIQAEVFKNSRPKERAYLLEHKDIEFLIIEDSHYYTYKKCMRIGIFDDSPIKQDESSQYGMVVSISEPSKKDNRLVRVSKNTISMYQLLKEIF